MSLEPGDSNLEGKNATLRIGTANALSNTAILAVEAFRSPLATTTVVPPHAAASDPAAKSGGPGFKLALLAVISVTVVCLAAMLIIAFALHGQPNSVQAKVLDTVTNVFVAGIGALIGLIGGKAS